MKNELNDTEKTLITRFLAGECPDEEQAALKAWRSMSDENEKAYRSFEKTFHAAGEYLSGTTTPPVLDVEAEWKVFLKSVRQNETPVRNINASLSWLKMAAAITFILVTAGLLYLVVTKPKPVLEVSQNETRTLSLPDGSRVVLNRHSSIAYNTDFADARNIRLTGEAFFEVQPDSNHPFIITAGETSIEVMGTSFTVSAYDSTSSVEVVVETGKVSFADINNTDKTLLTPGQKGLFNKQSKKIETGQNNDVNYQSWNTKTIVFQETDLKSVVETLNRTYDSKIMIATGVGDSCVVTVTFHNQSLDAVLNVLESTLNLTFRKTGNVIEIIEAGC